MDLGEFATADSIAHAVERAPGRLSPLDEHYLRWVVAQVRGEPQRALEPAREMVTIAPIPRRCGWWRRAPSRSIARAR